MSERQARDLPCDPFVWTPHLAALFDRQVMIAPLVVLWRYRVDEPERFCDWLATRDIVLNDRRIGQDAKLAGVRYCGTYISGSSIGPDMADCTTVWGYATREAMLAMHDLCANRFATRTIVQSDLFEFVIGLQGFLSHGDEDGFVQEVLVSAAAGAGRGIAT